MTIEQIETLAQLRPCFELRHEVYCKLMHAFPINPFEVECDLWDLRSFHFRAQQGGNLVGYARFVQSCKGHFPMEDHGFTLPPDFPRDKALEFSRFCVPPKSRVPRVSVQMVKAADQWSRDHGYTHWVFSSNSSVTALAEREGWRFDSLGEPKRHHNDLYHPFAIPLFEGRFGW